MADALSLSAAGEKANFSAWRSQVIGIRKRGERRDGRGLSPLLQNPTFGFANSLILLSPPQGGRSARFGTQFYPRPSLRPYPWPASREQGTRFHEPVGTGRGDGAEPEGDGVALWSETPGSGPSGRPEEAHVFPMTATVRGEMPDGRP